MGRTITLNTDIDHDKEELTTQEQATLLKRRIEEMKRNKTNVFIGQPMAKQSDDECYAEIINACQNFISNPVAETEQELAKTLEKHNLHLYCYKNSGFSYEKNRVARIAFDGHLPPRQRLNTSKKFGEIQGESYKLPPVAPESYNLSGTVWEIFKEIPELAVYEEKIRSGLAKNKVPPSSLTALRADDFLYVLSEQLTNDTDKGVAIMRESYKARNTKRFIEENEEEFRAGLLAMPGVKKEYVKTLIRAMKTGLTDLTKYKENGQFVWKEEWANQPVINVHHVINIKDSAAQEAHGKKWYNVNDYENMCFIVTYPQHNAMHALEKDLQGNNQEYNFNNREIKKNTFYRIQPPEGVRCMLGFHNMIYDRKYLGLPEKEKAEINQRAENNPNRISGSYGRRYANEAKDPYKARQDWKNRGRYDARYGNI